MQPRFTYRIPEYHSGQLFVQLRPTAAVAPAGIVAAAMLADPATPGLAALSFYERAGLVKRVVSVPRRSSRRPEPARAVFTGMAPGGLGASAVIAASAIDSGEQHGGGLSLVELERDEDVPKLQLAMASDPNVASVSRVPVRYLAVRAPRRPQRRRSGPAAPVAAGIIPMAAPPNPSTLWNLSKINWSEVRQLSGFADADDISVAVLDSGIEEAHPDLQDRIVDYTWAHPDLPQASSVNDLIGHGTHVAGTIAARFDNAFGVNGICKCRLRAWKIFDDIPDLAFTQFGPTYLYYVDPVMYLRALLDCVDDRLGVVNLSIGGPGTPSLPEAAAFAEMIANGTVVVAAMGNEREQGSPISYPAAIQGVIAVGATGITDRVANFSNRGNHISICAPGEAIWSTLPTYPGQFGWDAEVGPGGQLRQGKAQRRQVDYDAWDGTSMAAPHVAAAAALYLAKHGSVGPAIVRQALIESADKVPLMGTNEFHPDYGYGRLNLLSLLQ